MRDRQPLWHGAAFLVEALVLLAFLAASLAVLFSLFASSRAEADRAARLSEAVAIAQNAAEGIAAADTFPTDAVPATQTVTGAQTGTTYELAIELEPQATGAGTLWHATITVRDADAAGTGVAAAGTGTAGATDAAGHAADAGAEPLYTLETARYLPAEESAAESTTRGGERGGA